MPKQDLTVGELVPVELKACFPSGMGASLNGLPMLSGGAFTFASSNTAVATVSGRRVTLVGNGVTTLTATQAAAGNYTQATASTTLTVDARPDPTRDPSVVGGIFHPSRGR